MPKDYDITTLKEAIKSSGGFISVIAKKLGCEWHTAEKYVLMYPETAEAMKAEKESLLDLAESKLVENINDNDNTAINFYLSKQGGSRGYNPVEKTIVETKLTDSDRAEIIKSLKSND